jgi:mannan endo-1,4-beta-mannosidase
MKNINLNMPTFLKVILALATFVVSTNPVLAQQPAGLSALAPMTIRGGKLFDSHGQQFIFRGVTIDHTLAPDKTLQALKDISAAGANSAQIEFNLLPDPADDTWPPKSVQELRDIIAACKANKLVCVLEPNDVAGYPAYGGANGGAIASWWPTLMNSILIGNQSHIIIGFGNQHYVTPESPQDFESRMQSYIGELLAALPGGYLVMIDGDNWSEDTAKSALNFAIQLKSSSYSYSNRIIYSVDMFSSYENPDEIRNYLETFNTLDAPLVVGGFGPVPYHHPHRTTAFPTDAPLLPVTSVMQYAQEYGAGYFGWSWSGNKNSNLNLVTNYDASALTNWGNILFSDPNGIKATAKRASIYGNDSPSSISSSNSSASYRSSSSICSAPVASLASSSRSSSSSSSEKSSSSVRPSSSSTSRTSSSSSSITTGKAQCSYHVRNEWNTGFTAAIQVKNLGTQPISGWNLAWKYADSSRITNVWNATVDGTNPYTARGQGWNLLIQPGQTVEFGFQGSKPTGAASIPKVTGAICQ